MEEDDKENSPKHGPRHGEPTKKSKKRPRGSLMEIETEEEQGGEEGEEAAVEDLSDQDDVGPVGWKI